MDVIELRGVRASGRHGVLEHEKIERQPFLIDLRIELDLRVAGASDAIEDTVDYASLTSRITTIVEERSFALLERLAEEILRDVFSDRRIVRADIAITKPRALRSATPVVRLHRDNPRLQ